MLVDPTGTRACVILWHHDWVLSFAHDKPNSDFFKGALESLVLVEHSVHNIFRARAGIPWPGSQKTSEMSQTRKFSTKDNLVYIIQVELGNLVSKGQVLQIPRQKSLYVSLGSCPSVPV